GITHTDAFLNRQADGTEHTAQGVTHLDNADGSRTYRVDLQGIPAGTAVNLVFDLIGFGEGNSQITNDGIRVISTPIVHDDTATTAEDTALVIDALANDQSAHIPGFAPAVVTGPQHGQITLNADGTFLYQPDADYNGDDSFVYVISHGEQAS